MSYSNRTGRKISNGASADGKGFRLGWPGKKSVYTFAHSVRMVPAGMKIGR